VIRRDLSPARPLAEIWLPDHDARQIRNPTFKLSVGEH
jgi:hypothetical protein